MQSNANTAFQFGAPFVISLFGVWAFHWLELPLPWLLGPIAACLVAALLGMSMRAISVVNNAMRTVLGVAIGASFTPDVLASMLAMWPTLLMVPLMVICAAAIGVPYFQRLWRYDFPTSYYASMPGGLQDMLVFGEEAGGNPRTLSLVHATRILIIVVTLPFVIQMIWQVDLTIPPGDPAGSMPVSQLAIMIACAWIGWRCAKMVGLFGASILGPMIAAGAVSIGGLLENRPPAEAIWAAQFFIGMTVGTKYSGITAAEVRRDLLAGTGYCAILLLLAFAFVEIVYQFGFAPGMETLLAFSPGGQAEMVILALIVGADVAFVVAHHVVRIVFVILGAPVFARIFDRDQSD